MRTIFALVLIVFLSTAVCGCKKEDSAGMSPQRAESLIREQLPKGTDKAAVIRFLDSHKADYSSGADPLTLQAMIRDTGRSGVVSKSLQVLFKFDSKDKLQDFSVTEKYTGP